MDKTWLSECQTVVVDLGSGYLKCGFAGDDAPRAVFPSIVGKLKYKGAMVGMDSKNRFVGDHCILKSSVLNSIYPIQRGWFFDENYSDVQALLHHTPYNELCITPEDHAYIIPECVLNQKSSREKLTEMLFEVFNVPANCFALAPYLSHLYYTSCEEKIDFSTSDIICIDVGAGVTQLLYIESSTTKRRYYRSDLGGRDCTTKLFELLKESGQIISRNSTIDLEKTRIMKENYCCCDIIIHRKKNNNYKNKKSFVVFGESGITDPYHHKFSLPDREYIQLTDDHIYQPAEILFKDRDCDNNKLSVPQLIYKSIIDHNCNNKKKKKISILLNGGSTLFNGFSERLKNDVISKFNDDVDVDLDLDIFAVPERKFTAWMGGSILGDLSSFIDRLVTKQQFEEEGMRIVHKKIVK